MIDISKIDYSMFDRPEVLMFLFHPRPEWNVSQPIEGIEDRLIPIEKEVAIGVRFHLAGKSCPNILFFHGNGEIVADYDDMGQLYKQMNINFIPVDYRGYGRSTGSPTVTAMMRDCHVIFDYIKNWLVEKKHDGPFIVMGRSLGSASALELIKHYGSQIDGLIVESGFSSVGPLLELLGIQMGKPGVEGEDGLHNAEKIRSYGKPTLIIHAENDHIIPFHEGQALYDVCTAPDKRLLKIPGADHNSIFLHGIQEYMEAIKGLVQAIIDQGSFHPDKAPPSSNET